MVHLETHRLDTFCPRVPPWPAFQALKVPPDRARTTARYRESPSISHPPIPKRRYFDLHLHPAPPWHLAHAFGTAKKNPRENIRSHLFLILTPMTAAYAWKACNPISPDEKAQAPAPSQSTSYE